VKLFLRINNSLELHVICFQLEGIVISSKKAFGILDMDLRDIDGTINILQIREVFEPNHNLKQILPFWPLNLVFENNIDCMNEFM
jgi:hypothetical protein